MVSTILLALIRCYQLAVSPWLPPMCRFDPSCSRYTAEAIRVHGPARGTWLGVKRILRCRPGCEPGYDPVPLRDEPPAKPQAR